MPVILALKSLRQEECEFRARFQALGIKDLRDGGLSTSLKTTTL